MIGTLVALYARESSGDGQVVDVASLDAMFSCLGTRPSAFAMLGEMPQRCGSRDLLTGPANVFAARDGYVYIHGGTNPLFPRLCAAMGRSDLAGDARFAEVPGRLQGIAELEAAVSAWSQAHTVAEILMP